MTPTLRSLVSAAALAMLALPAAAQTATPAPAESAPAPEAVAAADAVAALFDDPKLAESMRRLALARAARDARKQPPFSHDRKATP